MTTPDSNNVQSSPAPVSTTPVQPSSADPAVAGEAARANKTRKDYSSTNIGSIGELKDYAPDLYKKMMEGIALTIIRGMRKHLERMKKMMRESRELNR